MRETIAMSYRSLRLGFSVVVLIAAVWPVVADAQTLSTADQRSQAYQSLATTCAADMARFCPHADVSPAAAREQFLCLKVYRVDLARTCRKAVNAISTISPAGGDQSN
jgi:hypothetical protein